MNHSRSFNLVIGLILCVLGAVLVLLPVKWLYMVVVSR